MGEVVEVLEVLDLLEGDTNLTRGAARRSG
jgi:hypothetical protein